MPRSNSQVCAVVLPYPPPISQSSRWRPDAKGSRSTSTVESGSLATNPSAGLVTESHPPTRRRRGLVRMFAAVACLVLLACPTAAFAQEVEITSIATDNRVNASEKSAGFKIIGTTKDGSLQPIGNINVTATIAGTALPSVTSGNDGVWEVIVPGEKDYITHGNGQTVTVEAVIGGSTESDTANFDVDLTLPLEVNAVAGDNRINIADKAGGITISGKTGAIGGVTVTVTIDGTALPNATSNDNGDWEVEVDDEKIEETSVLLSVTATKAGYTDATPVSQTVPVDLTPPSVTYTAPSRLIEDVLINISPTTDDTDIVSYKISEGSLPEGLSLIENSGLITGSPNKFTNSTKSVTVTVTDGFGNTATEMIVFPEVELSPEVLISPEQLMVPEGASAQYTVVLNIRPGNTVTITLGRTGGPSDPDLTADKATLTFTDSDWSKPQTVTISAAEDDDGLNGQAQFQHSVAGPGTAYDGLPSPGINVYELDNDKPGVTISPLSLTVPEGGTAQYTVVLDTEPEEEVGIEVTVDGGGDDDLTVSSDTDTDTDPDSVTFLFTLANWNTEQTVTVSAAQDTDQVHGVTIFSHGAAGGNDYYDILIDSVTANEGDDEDETRPTVEIRAEASIPVGGAFEVTIHFSESVIGFALTDIDVSNATATNFNRVSLQTYTVTITPDGTGEVRVAIGSHVAWDRAGNGNQAAEAFEVETKLVVSYQEENYTAREGGETVTVTVKLSRGWDEDLAIPIRVTRPETTEAGDYTVEELGEWDAQAGAGTLTFPAEETKQTFTITANHDGDGEDETVELGFGELPEMVVAGEPAAATVTLEDKGLVELKVSFGRAEYQIGEGRQADIEVKVAPPADRRVEVPLVVAPKGGASDEDYSVAPAKVVFEEGESEGTISVEVLADEVNDPGEGIVLSLGELPEAVSAGDPSSTQVQFRQPRTAEQFSQTLEAMLAVITRSMGESAKTAIEGRFERHRQWRRLGAAGGAAIAPRAWVRENRSGIGSESLEGSGGRRAEGPVVQSAWGATQASAATGSGWNSENRETGTPGSWLRSLSLGPLGDIVRSGQTHLGASAGSGMEPSGGVYGQDRLYGGGVGDAPLGVGSGDFSGVRNQEVSLLEVSFEMAPGESEKETGWVPVLWGQGDLRRFNGHLTRIGMDYRGGLEAAHVGLDLYADDKVLAGLSFMRSWGNMDYSDDGIDGVLESRMSTFHPYLYWQPNERLSVWGIGGLGGGQVDVTEPGRVHDFDADFWMFAAGVRTVLSTRGNNEWGLRADVFTAQLETDASEDIVRVSGEAHRGRLMLEWVHDRELSVGRHLSLKAEAGGRFDWGDAERGGGVETGFRLGYLDANSGLDVALHGRVLVAHESDYRDWGVGVQASWDPGEKQRGFRVSVNTSLGQDGGGRTTLWDNADAVTRPVGTGALGQGSQFRMESEVAYGGMKAPGLPGLLTPYGRLRWAGQGRELALGAAWSLPSGSQQALPSMLEVETLRRERSTGPAVLAVLLRMSIPF